MHDSYLLLTPVLTFLVVALVGFVGCDQLFGLDHVETPPEPPAAPSGLKAEPGDGKVTLSWPIYTGGADKLTVKWGTQEGSHPESHDLSDPSTIGYEVSPLTNGVTYYFVLSATKGSTQSADSEEVSGVPGLYGVVMPFIDPATVQRGDQRQFTGWLGMGFRTGPSSLTLRQLGRWFDGNITGAHAIRIVAASNPTLVLASVVVSKTAVSAENKFVYETVPSAITLDANADYYVVSQEDAAADYFYDSVNTRVTILNAAAGVSEFAVYGDDAGNYTRDTRTGYAYGPVDFTYTLP